MKRTAIPEGLVNKLTRIDGKVIADSSLMKLYTKNPGKFLKELGLTPEEIEFFKINDGELTRSCSCCAVFFGSCGTGCGSYGGHTVG
jgi:hypothetical protein